MVRLIPAPRMNEAQRALIAADYGMCGQQLNIQTRAALVSYLLQQLRLNSQVERSSPEAQKIVMGNADEIRRGITMAG